MKSTNPTICRRALTALFIASAGVCSAATNYVDPVDIIIPFTVEGVYLDIATGGINSSTQGGAADPGGDSYTVSYSEPASGDWDVNFFLGGSFIAHNVTFQPYREDGGDNLSAIHNVAPGAEIDGGAIVPVPAGGPSVPLAVAGFGGSGTTVGGGLTGAPTATHMGGAVDQFSSGTPGYVAFVLNPGTVDEAYGWIRVTLSDDGSTGIIHDWAYSDSPLEVGVIPEPSGLLLVALGGLTFLLRRSRGS